MIALRVSVALGVVISIGSCARLIDRAIDPPPEPKHSYAPLKPAKEIVANTLGPFRQLIFIDDGAALLAARDGLLEVIDPIRRVSVARTRLKSAHVADHSPGAAASAYREQSFDEPIWGWDSRARTVIGIGCVTGTGDVVRGLSTWAPGHQPVPVSAALHDECRPLAAAPDLSWFAARTSKRTLQRFTPDAIPLGTPIALADDPVIAAVSPDGGLIATADSGGGIELYDIASAQVRSWAGGANHEVRKLVFDPSRPRLIALSNVDAVAWNFASNVTTQIAANIHAVAFSADGKQLALADPRSISIVDSATFARIRSLDVRQATNLVFSPDGSRLAVATSSDLQIHALATTEPKAIDAAWLEQLAELPIPDPEREPPFALDGVVSGVVMNGSSPVVDADVVLSPRDRWPRAQQQPALHARTNHHGAFEFSRLARINWQVEVTSPGLAETFFIAELRTSPKVTSVVSLDPAITVRGIVLAPDGSPAANAEVAVASSYSNHQGLLVTAGSDGRFTIDHLRANSASTFTIAAWGSDGSVGVTTTAIATKSPVDVAIRLHTSSAPEVLHVQVTDETGVPLAGVHVASPMGDFPRTTGPDGIMSIVVTPRAIQNGGIEISYDRHYANHARIPWPVRGVVPVALRLRSQRSTPPAACLEYRDAVARVERCDRVPKATRDALQAELDRQAATWTEPSDPTSYCSINMREASEEAERCH